MSFARHPPHQVQQLPPPQPLLKPQHQQPPQPLLHLLHPLPPSPLVPRIPALLAMPLASAPGKAAMACLQTPNLVAPYTTGAHLQETTTVPAKPVSFSPKPAEFATGLPPSRAPAALEAFPLLHHPLLAHLLLLHPHLALLLPQLLHLALYLLVATIATWDTSKVGVHHGAAMQIPLL